MAPKAEPLPVDVTEELRHRYEVRFTYHSTAIEGNTLTQSETQMVIEKGLTIAGRTLAEHLPTDHHPVEFGAEAHVKFVTIRPFRDGNGRVGRLLMNLILIRSKFPIAIIPVTRRSEYVDALALAQSSGDRCRLDNLLVDAVTESLKDTLATALSSDSVPIEIDLRSEISAWTGVH